MKIKIDGDSTTSYTNYISFIKFNITNIPTIAFKNYFIKTKENMYFLCLSTLQLCTHPMLSIFPSNWSPTGPFSTGIPLSLCFLLEVSHLCIKHIDQRLKTIRFNHKQTQCFNEKCIEKKFNKDIKKGDVLHIKTNDVFPVDCVLLSVEPETVAKVTYSNLNGEPDVIIKHCIPVSIQNVESLEFKEIKEHKCVKRFDCKLFVKSRANQESDVIHVTDKHFIAGGCINLGEPLTVIVTEIGDRIRSYSSVDRKNIFIYNPFNVHLSHLLQTIYIPLFIFIILACIGASMYHTNETHTLCTSIYFVIQYLFQFFILFNGIVPFSSKIILIINRNIQYYVSKSRNTFEFLHTKAMDTLPYTKHLISDKTGTITKNILSLQYFMNEKHMVTPFQSIVEYPIMSLYVLLSIHKQDVSFSTNEDQILYQAMMSIGYTYEKKIDNKINITQTDNHLAYTFDIIQQNSLTFTSQRKLSSIIIKDKRQRIFIITKGSMDKIESLLTHKDPLQKDRKELNKEKNAHYRTLSIALREITHIYRESIDPRIYEEKNSYTYCTTLCILDNIQPYVDQTINFLHKQNIQVSMCTGDRKETALSIARKIKLFSNRIQTCVYDNNTPTLSTYNLLLSGDDIETHQKSVRFQHVLIGANAFVGYSMLPKHKKLVCQIFRQAGVHTTSIGDGNNDIAMFNTTHCSISLDSGLNNNVVSNSHMKVKQFWHIIPLYKCSKRYLQFNINTLYLIFYRTLLFHLNLMIYFFKHQSVPFTFLDVQLFNIWFSVFPILYACFYTYKGRFVEECHIRYNPLAHVLTHSLLVYPFSLPPYVSIFLLVQVSFYSMYGKEIRNTLFLNTLFFILYMM